MDYRQFLQNSDSEKRLPYVAGLKTCDEQRSWRLRDAVSPRVVPVPRERAVS